MNILMISHKIKNAAGPRSHAMAEQLVLRGHTVDLVLISPTSRKRFLEYDWDGVHIIESPDLLPGRMRSGWDPWDIINRILFLKKHKGRFDLIHCFETRPVTIHPALYLSRRTGTPVITDWNDWWGRHGLIEVNRPAYYRYLAGWLETYYEEAFRANQAGLTVIADGLKERAIKLGVQPDRICKIPGGARTELFPLRTKADCRNHIGLPLDQPILGFCSADSHLDLEIVFSSLLIVSKKYPSVVLLITGKPKSAVREMADRLQLNDRIIFTGFLPLEDYPIYLGACDLFLLPMADRPYNLGRWPNKMGDYLAIARPTVTNPIGDIGTLFQKHKVGLTAPWNPEIFADQIIYLLEHEDEAQEMGNTARWVAENEYSWSGHGEKLEDFYRLILEKERRTVTG